MEFRNVRVLRGPNIWARFPVLEASVDPGVWRGVNATQLPLVVDRLSAWLPGGRESLASAVSLVEVVGIAARELQTMCGSPVTFCKTTMYSPSDYRVVVQYREEKVGLEAFEKALELVRAAVNGQPFPLEETIEALRDKDQRLRLGPSTNSVVQAAIDRGIPVRRMNEDSLVQIGHSSKQRRICAAETSRTSAIAESIAQDKELTKELLRAVGVPVPWGRQVCDANDAWEAAQEIGVPVVVKPQFGNQGRGVAVNLITREQVMAAFDAAQQEGKCIMVEKFAPGQDHRVLVVGDKVIAAARREPPKVTGDGVHTIAQLVEIENRNPLRGEEHATALSKLRLDDIGLAVLAEQKLTAETILPAGKTVAIRANANLSTGGSATDVTDEVHPDVASRMVDAVRMIGLDVAGIDVVCTDISRPLEEQHGVVVEINAVPGLRMHLQPSFGKGRNVGEAIMATLFAPQETGRIPIVAVTGVNGKTTTTRLISHIVGKSGKKVGMTCTDGIYVGGRRISTGDCAGPQSARAVLSNPLVDAAVFETARGGILREGLGFDRCDVAVVTNIGEGDHLGQNGIETLDQLARVKRVIVENVAPHGMGVLNADDPYTADMAAHCTGKVVFYSRHADNALVASHRAAGGRAVYVQNGALYAAEGGWEAKIASLSAIPMTLDGRIGFQVENALAAASAAWALGIAFETIRTGLETFVVDSKVAPGRFNIMSFRGATILVDYGHNVSALNAMIDAIGKLPHERRLCVYTTAGDRRDEDILRQAELIGHGFDEVMIYEDSCSRGRGEGEVVRLMRQGLTGGKRLQKIRETRGELNAVETMLRQLQAGDILFLQADQVELVLDFLPKFFASEEQRAAEPAIGQMMAAPVRNGHVPAPSALRLSE